MMHYASGVCTTHASIKKTEEIRRAERRLGHMISSMVAHMDYTLTRQLNHWASRPNLR
jgi:hypothetical protein